MREYIAREFGQHVLNIVDACTDDEGHEKAGFANEQDEAVAWRRRKEQYIAHLMETQDAAALRVSCADKLHNSRSLLFDYREVGDSLWQRFRTKSREDQLWCYRQLCRVFLEREVGSLAVELDRTVTELASISSQKS